MVRLESEGDASYLGAGVFESTARNQSRSQPAFPGAAARFRIRLQNAGAAADRFVLRAEWNPTGLTVRCLDRGGTDRAAALAGGSGYPVGILAPGESVTVSLEVAPSALPLGASYRVTFSAASVGDPAATDQLKTETVACTATAAVIVSTPPDSWGFPGNVVDYPYTVTNVGNTTESFVLSAAGDWSAAVYADDGAGGGVASDGARQGGEASETASTGLLPPGAAYRFFVAVTVPPASADRAHADTRLSVQGQGASGSDQVTTTAIAAVITVAESVRNLTRGGPFTASAEAYPGDLLQYRMTLTNSGSTSATSVGIDAPLPEHTSCLPGSLWIGTGAAGDGPACAAEQCGSVRESSGRIVARLGQGASEAAGGVVAPGRTLHVFYRVQVE